MKLTPWFPPEVKPVRVGVYDFGAWYRFWNGSDWKQGTSSVEGAYLLRHGPVSKIANHQQWRGLAEKP